LTSPAVHLITGNISIANLTKK